MDGAPYGFETGGTHWAEYPMDWIRTPNESIPAKQGSLRNVYPLIKVGYPLFGSPYELEGSHLDG